jgi:hypothetical protein
MTNSEVLKMREKLDNLTDAIDNIDNFVFLKTNEDNVKDSWSSVWNFLNKLSKNNFTDVEQINKFAKENAE